MSETGLCKNLNDVESRDRLTATEICWEEVAAMALRPDITVM